MTATERPSRPLGLFVSGPETADGSGPSTPCMWRVLTGERRAYEVCVQDHECYGIRLRSAS